MNNPLIGIIGGMGPLASSGFVNYLYQKCHNKFSDEQKFPRIILISDPTIPDRMESIKNNMAGKVTTILENKIQELLFLGATKILICCFTAHYFYTWFSQKSKNSILHLGTLIDNHLSQNQEKTLIIATKLLINSSLIKSNFAVYPNTIHLDEIHQIIYGIKCNGAKPYQDQFITLVSKLAAYYNVSHVLLACTELHLMHQCLTAKNMNPKAINIYDGLNIAANFIINLYDRNSTNNHPV